MPGSISRQASPNPERDRLLPTSSGPGSADTNPNKDLSETMAGKDEPRDRFGFALIVVSKIGKLVQQI
jgi:hypothetical protein